MERADFGYWDFRFGHVSACFGFENQLAKVPRGRGRETVRMIQAPSQRKI
jgi:hypothetical protein